MSYQIARSEPLHVVRRIPFASPAPSKKIAPVPSSPITMRIFLRLQGRIIHPSATAASVTDLRLDAQCPSYASGRLFFVAAPF